MFVDLSEDNEILGYQFTPGWEHSSERDSPAFWPFGWFLNDNPWDDWDQELLRNSKEVELETCLKDTITTGTSAMFQTTAGLVQARFC